MSRTFEQTLKNLEAETQTVINEMLAYLNTKGLSGKQWLAVFYLLAGFLNHVFAERVVPPPRPAVDPEVDELATRLAADPALTELVLVRLAQAILASKASEEMGVHTQSGSA